jgi:hypothetical protein
MAPNPTNAPAAKILTAWSGRRVPSSAPTAIASASAANIPAVEPSQVPIGHSVVASVILGPASMLG